VRSYKIRGAYYAMANLNEQQRDAGIVAASAGNHAQGVAYACRTMGIRGRIFVPNQTLKQKRDRIMVHGGDMVELVVTGNTFDARDTVIGQGTIAAVILTQLTSIGKSLDTVLVPVGGGGLLAGVASYLADMAPRTAIVGVEPGGAASLQAALRADAPVTLSAV